MGSRIAQEFTVSVETPFGDEEWFRFVVYHTQAGMIAASRRWQGEAAEDYHAATFGVTDGMKGSFKTSQSRPRATIRLCRDALTRSLLLHEVTHAALASYKWMMLLHCESTPWDENNHDFINHLEALFARANATIRWELSRHPMGIDAWGDAADEAVGHGMWGVPLLEDAELA